MGLVKLVEQTLGLGSLCVVSPLFNCTQATLQLSNIRKKTCNLFLKRTVFHLKKISVT